MGRFWVNCNVVEYGMVPIELFGNAIPEYDLLKNLAKKIYSKQQRSSVSAHVRFLQWQQIAKKYLSITNDEVARVYLFHIC